MAALDRDQVEKALDIARVELNKHGGNVLLMGVNDEGVVLVKLAGACSGCSSAKATLKDIIEKTLKEQLPQVSRVEALL